MSWTLARACLAALVPLLAACSSPPPPPPADLGKQELVLAALLDVLWEWQETETPNGSTSVEDPSLDTLRFEAESGRAARGERTGWTAARSGARTAVTGGQCGPRQVSTGGACDGRWLGCAQTDGRPSEWIGCERILSVSTPGATLLSPDYAILELAKDTTRPSIPLGDRDVAFGEVVQTDSVTVYRFYDDVRHVRSRRHVVADKRQFSPWSATACGSLTLLSAGPIRPGSPGAPVPCRRG